MPGIAAGRPALLSVLQLKEEEWQAEDSTGKKMATWQQLVPVMSVRGSEIFEAQPAERGD